MHSMKCKVLITAIDSTWLNITHEICFFDGVKYLAVPTWRASIRRTSSRNEKLSSKPIFLFVSRNRRGPINHLSMLVPDRWHHCFLRRWKYAAPRNGIRIEFSASRCFDLYSSDASRYMCTTSQIQYVSKSIFYEDACNIHFIKQSILTIYKTHSYLIIGPN